MPTYVPRDRFYRKARKQGLASRAAFKVVELIDRFNLVKRGARVIDLGCAPGGWLAILARAVGPGGKVVGVDLAECGHSAPSVVTIAGDVLDPATADAVAAELVNGADLITSDLSPKLSGIAERDQARARELIEAALTLAERSLRPGGAMVAKLFMHADFDQLVGKFKARFRDVRVARTKASRPGSSELYIVARGFGARRQVRAGGGLDCD